MERHLFLRSVLSGSEVQRLRTQNGPLVVDEYRNTITKYLASPLTLHFNNFYLLQ
jgi:hypothetical protein